MGIIYQSNATSFDKLRKEVQRQGNHYEALPAAARYYPVDKGLVSLVKS